MRVNARASTRRALWAAGGLVWVATCCLAAACFSSGGKHADRGPSQEPEPKKTAQDAPPPPEDPEEDVPEGYTRIVWDREGGRKIPTGAPPGVGADLYTCTGACELCQGKMCCWSGVEHARDAEAGPQRQELAECLLGGDGPDEIHGGPGDSLVGGGGDDTLQGDVSYAMGNRGDDTISGGDSSNILEGGPGNDRIFGLGGDDRLRGHDGADHIEGGPGDDELDGGSGEDVLIGGAGDDTILGGYGNDDLRGGDGDDYLDGFLDGNDRLFGGSGDDVLLARGGDDVVDGGEGHDVLLPGPGRDEVRGGPGDDEIVVLRACEATGPKVIDGGTGHDVLIIPVSWESLAARGWTRTGIEEVEIRNSPCGALCGGGCLHGRCDETSDPARPACECLRGFAGRYCDYKGPLEERLPEFMSLEEATLPPDGPRLQTLRAAWLAERIDGEQIAALRLEYMGSRKASVRVYLVFENGNGEQLFVGRMRTSASSAASQRLRMTSLIPRRLQGSLDGGRMWARIVVEAESGGVLGVLDLPAVELRRGASGTVVYDVP